MSVLTTDSSMVNTTSASHVGSKEELLGEVFEWLYSLTNTFDEKSREIEIATGISKNHALAIKVISRSPAITVSVLAKRMHINAVTMVRILDRLEKQEFITRTRSLKDRRVVEVRITEKAYDIELMLGNMTHDILMCCLAATDDRDLLKKLLPLQSLTAHSETA